MKLLNLFPYFGGKYRMVKKLLPLFPKHFSYVEPFCGSCVVLLNKVPANKEVINDSYNEIYNLFTVVKNKPKEFYDSFKYTFTSRSYFNYVSNMNTDNLTDVQRAHRFFYFICHVYNNAPTNTVFRTYVHKASKLDYNNIQNKIDKVYDRLKNVVIECLDYVDVVSKYDHERTFYFIDPPYFYTKTKSGRRYEYTDTFETKDFLRLSSILKEIKGKFLMTINDCEFIRDVYRDFNLSTIDTTYGCNSRMNGIAKHTELLVSNYDIKPRRWKLK